jgi:translation elongation factor EF-Tu-like GTPase
MPRPPHPPDIEADISFISTDAGGKTHAVRSGYRPHHDFGLEGMFNDAHHEYIGVESVAPGTTARTQLWLLAPELQARRLFPGFKFSVHEGARVVAHGIVVNVINPALRIRA